MRKVFIASDHAGLALKEMLAGYLREMLSCDVEDLGAHALSMDDDYPDIIRPCAERVAGTQGSFGIVIGGSGQGEAMVANRVPGVRCALYYGKAHIARAIDAKGAPGLDRYDIVRLARQHNDANMLSLGARFIDADDAKQAARIFLEAEFSGEERHARRIGKF